MLGSAAALAGASYGVWYALDQALGRSLFAQIASLLVGAGAGLAVYVVGVLALRVPEAGQIGGWWLGAPARRLDQRLPQQ